MQLFNAGIGPGLLVASALILMVQIWCRVQGHGKEDGTDKQPIIASFFKAFWALMMPVIIIVVNLALGMFTPPLGVNLFAAAQVASIPVQHMFKTLVIPVLTMITALMIITYVPMDSLFLRDLMQ